MRDKKIKEIYTHYFRRKGNDMKYYLLPNFSSQLFFLLINKLHYLSTSDTQHITISSTLLIDLQLSRNQQYFFLSSLVHEIYVAPHT